jgi:hypothetical protein
MSDYHINIFYSEEDGEERGRVLSVGARLQAQRGVYVPSAATPAACAHQARCGVGAICLQQWVRLLLRTQ